MERNSQGKVERGNFPRSSLSEKQQLCDKSLKWKELGHSRIHRKTKQNNHYNWNKIGKWENNSKQIWRYGSRTILNKKIPCKEFIFNSKFKGKLHRCFIGISHYYLYLYRKYSSGLILQKYYYIYDSNTGRLTFILMFISLWELTLNFYLQNQKHVLSRKNCDILFLTTCLQ